MDKAIEAAARAFEQEYFGPHLHITARTSLAIGEAINAAIAAYEAAREAEGFVWVPVTKLQEALDAPMIDHSGHKRGVYDCIRAMIAARPKA